MKTSSIANKRWRQSQINQSVVWVVAALEERSKDLQNTIRMVRSLSLCACDVPEVWRDPDGWRYCHQCGLPAREKEDGLDE